jgi:hypothetical protein
MTTFTNCWTWKGAKIEGYGIVRRDGKAIRIHRLIWEALYGPIPITKELDHVCRNTLCANPDHLELVSHKINVLRGTSPSALNAKKTHAPCGHPYTDKDAIRRYCKPCRQQWHREYYRKERASI